MSDNDRVLLDAQFKKFKDDHPDVTDDAHAFEYFAATQVLKPLFELDDQEILDGMTRTDAGSGGNDGGIDSAYGFVNQSLIEEDTKPSAFGKDSVMQFAMVQATRTAGFDEKGIYSLAQSVKHLFDLSLDQRTIRNRYNTVVREKFQTFRKFIQSVSPKRLDFHFYYVSRGDTPAQNTVDLSVEVRSAVKGLFSGATVDFQFVTAERLYELTHMSSDEVLTLDFSDVAESPDGKGFLAYVKLRDLYRLISTDDGALKTRLFEANVRDYQGANEVNSAIKRTLGATDGEDFWALNNGITIVADEAEQRARQFRLENPRIVNGLQTSKEVHLYFSSGGGDSEDRRLVVVRVVVPRTPDGRNDIIFSTNSQTKIPIANLRATDRFQAQIEDFLLKYDYYYDRRKNFYRNQGKRPTRIIRIVFLAQAVTSILLKQPSVARARPSQLLSDDTEYERVFNPNRPLETYLCCALILLQTQHAVASANLPQKVRNNIRFHVALCYALQKVGSMTIKNGLRYQEFKVCDDALMQKSIAEIRRIFDRLGRTAKFKLKTEDQRGKSAEFEESTLRSVRGLVDASKRRKSPRRRAH